MRTPTPRMESMQKYIELVTASDAFKMANANRGLFNSASEREVEILRSECPVFLNRFLVGINDDSDMGTYEYTEAQCEKVLYGIATSPQWGWRRAPHTEKK